ncbi:MAG: AAA domain-containing protein [Lachnospiraceae bacterium]|jgi:hypothetical protein|uniref:McrB family protein n=1 Tax=Candidatus Merdisoma sp. JLR.KK006 TaxID=3112626 RepID=UPI002FEE8930|nr:AAA domain-containing protein [Lachnospiraceae bacterium]
MVQEINVNELSDSEKQALVCMYYARLPKTDARYKNRMDDWSVLEKRFGIKKTTYKYAKDSFDYYFPDNGRRGWSDERPLSRRGESFQEVYDSYKDYPVDVLEKATVEIIAECKQEENSFVSMKCGFPQTVHNILNGEKNITVDGVYTLKEELTNGKKVFVTLGGDVGKSEVDWKPGFKGVAHVTKEPYDFGYNGKGKYFKFDIEIDCVFKKAFKREDFLNYIDAYDAPYIGPELSRDPSQALSTLDIVKAVAVIRAVLDEYPYLLENFKRIFPQDFMDRVLGAVTVMIPASVKFGENKSDAVNSIYEDMEMEEDAPEEEDMDYKPYIEPEYYTGCSCKNRDTGEEYAHNRIVFGAPGTGKSYRLNCERADLIENGGGYERVTFHPDYSYAHFVGTYKPVPSKAGISYEFVPGPFMRTYVRAIENGRSENKEDVKPYLLLIEEINRANVAAVFGEVFQLLDRDERNVSQYPVKPSEDIKAYLAKELGGQSSDYEELRLPDNMYIWATMNSADQGVFPMDTAFKRRWDFAYIGIDDNDEGIRGKTVILGRKVVQKVEWNKLRKAINKFLAKQKINEDKQLGPYFISKNIVIPQNGDEIDRNKFIETFKNKVIMYLFEDAARQKRASLFEGCFQKSSRYSEICHEFDEKGLGIFNRDIQIDTKPEDLPAAGILEETIE